MHAETWRRSLGDRLVTRKDGQADDGFVWGVGDQNLYPAMSQVLPSEGAATWAASVEIEFHEIRVETEARTISVVFSELETSDVQVGYSPFAARDDNT